MLANTSENTAVYQAYSQNLICTISHIPNELGAIVIILTYQRRK